MKNKISLIGIMVSMVFCLLSCVTDKATTNGDATITHYASLLNIEEADSFTLVKVANPWDKHKNLATYVLVAKTDSLPTHLPKGDLLRTPIERVALTSSVHMALMFDLQTEAYMVGVTDTAYVISPTVKKYIEQHKEIANLGTSLSPDLERMKKTNTEAIWVSPFENADYDKLSHSGVALIQCADYMENSPLGRAEWVRFYGRLFGQAERADSMFHETESRYKSLKEMVEKRRSKRPTVMCDLRMGNMWFQPGGESTMGMFIADAGGHYLWSDKKVSGSVPLDVENVLKRGKGADIWLIKYGQATNLTYQQLKKDYPPYAQFKAWKTHNIWGCNTLHTAFYEEVPFHPERLLENLISIFQSGSSTSVSPYYVPMQ